MPKQDDKNFGTMTWSQSTKLWWAITWRCVIIGFVPLILIGLVLMQIMPKSLATYITNLLLIPIVIAVQRHVINKIKFSNFYLEANQLPTQDE